ncbi:MAG: hypothetical protein ACXU8U_04190 [Asticcacaulis sp.]
MARALPTPKPAVEGQFTIAREMRNLAHLNRSASSHRVLNLSKIWLQNHDSEDHAQRPLFENSALNRAIILKHTLRLDERHLFGPGRTTVTKIILPFDAADLSLGGRSFFFRQKGFEELMSSFLGIDDLRHSRDAAILRCLDGLPSLDPFLVREHLLRMKVRPAGCYFQISSADLKAMGAFTASEIENLVEAAFGKGKRNGAAKLGTKILSDRLDQELWPLKEALGMTDAQFSAGISSWRGFLYYKWAYVQLQDGIREVLSGLSHYKPVPTHDDMLRTYLRRARPRLAKAVVKTIQEAGRTLETYDEVYRAMDEDRNPEPFRQFLLRGSELFFELGDKLGTLNHIVSFWRFRMTRLEQNGARPLESIEYADILIDFEAGLQHSVKN